MEECARPVYLSDIFPCEVENKDRKTFAERPLYDLELSASNFHAAGVIFDNPQLCRDPVPFEPSSTSFSFFDNPLCTGLLPGEAAEKRNRVEQET